MCRLLGYAAPALTTATEVLGTDSCDEFQHLGRLHSDGWGTAWLEGDRVRRYRDPLNGTASPDLTGALSDTPSTARLVHLRLATTGMRNQISNTHPFVVDGIALAHNGSILPAEHVRARVSETELARIGGTTDTAVLFALVLRKVAAGASVHAAVSQVVAELHDEFPTASLNLLVLTKDELIAVHSNEFAPVPVDEFSARGLADLPRDHLDHYYRLSWKRGDDGTIAFSSSGILQDGWQSLPQHAVARVDLATLSLEIAQLPTGIRTAAAA